MNNAPACLKRAAECTRLAEATSDPEMKVYLLKLGLSWMQAATRCGMNSCWKRATDG